MVWALLGWMLAGGSAHAQWRRVVNLGDLRGSAIGGGVGNTLYSALNSGHVFRSDDNGLNWVAVTNGLVDSSGRMLLPKAFVVTPTGRVIRGGDNASWENKAGSPIFTTDTRGARWNEVPLPFASPTRNPAGIGISDLVVHQGAVYFSDLLSEGVWKSVDDGVTWAAVGEGLPTMPFVGFVKTYYAVASAGSALLTVEPTRGIFRSVDGGATWVQSVSGISGVMNSPLLGGRTWNGIDVVGAAEGTAYAVLDNRLYRSRDAGGSWVEVGGGIIVGPNPFVPSVIEPKVRKVEMLGDRVFVSTSDGNPRFFEGTAYGDSWTELPRIEVGGETASILAQSFYAHNGALYFAGSDGIHRLDLGSTVRTNVLPRVTTQPAGPFGVNVGGTLRIAASVAGTAPFTYEWRLNDQPIAGQTAAELVFSPGAGTVGGALTLSVRNAAGTVTHSVGEVSVVPVSPGAIDYGFRPVVSVNTFSMPKVTAFGFAPDGSVYVAGSILSAAELYTGVRRVDADGRIDASFVSGSTGGGGAGPGASVGAPTVVLPLGDGSVLVGASDTGDNARYYRRLLPDGSADTAWPWPAQIAGGPRKIVRLADGRFLVAGGSLGGLHRLEADGSYDPTFRGPTSIGRFQVNYVQDFVLLPDGRILIVGSFATVDGIARVSVARLLPDGALDSGWVPAALPVGSLVNAVALLPDGRILIGGAFLTVGGQAHRNLALLRADGSVDAALADLIPVTNPAGVVHAFAVQPDGRVWVGGAFSGVAGRTHVFRLTKELQVDTAIPDLGFEAGGGQEVRALAFTPDGRLWIGSGATRVAGAAAGQLLRVFTDVMGPTVGYAGLDQTPNPGEPVVLRATVSGPHTGLQWRFEGQPIVGATTAEWSLGPASLATSGRYDLVVTSSGGSYTSAPVAVRVRGRVVIDRSPISVVGIVSNSVTFGGSAFGRLPLGYQWLKDGLAIAGATNRSLSLTNLQLSAAGDYALRVAGGDGSEATSEAAYLTVIPMPGGTNAGFRARLFRTATFTVFKDIVFLPDGRVIVAGNFATVTNGPNALLARLEADGSPDTSFRFEAGGLSEIIGVERQGDGRLVILVRGNTYLVRRLEADGSLDPTFVEAAVDSGTGLELAADGGVLVLGMQGMLRLNPDGTPDSAFNQRARLNGAAESVQVDPAGRIYVAGSFTSVDGQPRSRLARLQKDGSLDTAFAPTNALGVGRVTALADGVLFGDLSGFYRFDEAGQRDPGYGWGSRLEAWDVDGAGGLVGILPGTTGEGILRGPDGRPASPVSTMKVPPSFSGYSFVRVAPDGAYWLALGGDGFTSDPAARLFRLNGTVTPLALPVSPASRTVNQGATVTLVASATGTSRIAYQWRRNGLNLPGQIQPTLVLENVRPEHAGDYTVVVSNRAGELVSRPATVVVLAAPEILALAGGGEFGLGDPLVMTVTARGIAPLSYQWRRDGAPLSGAVLAGYTNRALALTDAGTYDVVVANALGGVTSAPVVVRVVVRPGAVVGSFTTLSAGSGMELNLLPNGDFLVDDKAYNRFGEFLFRLAFPDGTSTVLRDRIVVDEVRQRVLAGPTRRVRAYHLDGTLISGFAGPQANVRMVRAEAGGTVLQSVEGAVLPFDRLDGTTGVLLTNFTPATVPTLDAQPLADGRVLVLASAQKIVGGRVIYNTILDRLKPDGASDGTFARSTNVFPQGGQATRLAVDRNRRILVLGGTGVTNTARIVRLTPDGLPDSGFRPPVINGEVSAVAEQLNGRLVIVGAFTTVGGKPRSLVARLNSDGSLDEGFDPGSGLTRASGQNTAFDVLVLPTGEILITGTFERANGMARSGAVLLCGDSLDLYFGTEPEDQEVVAGGTVELAALGTGTSAVAYQWFKNGEPVAGATTPTLRMAGADAGTAGDYHVVIRNRAGELTSRVARVDVILPPEITTSPESQVVDFGSSAVFGVEATGRRLGYQWRYQGADITGATNASYTVTNAGAPQVGVYDVVVRNAAGTRISVAARLRVRPAPAPAAGVPTNGLVGELKFEGSFAESARRFTTTAKGQPTFVSGVGGGQAARFLSSTNWLQMGAVNARLGGPTYSASFWIWAEDRGSINVYSLTVTAGGFGREQSLYLGGDDGTIQGRGLLVSTRGYGAVESTDGRAYVPNLVGRWTHIVVTYHGPVPGVATNHSVYIDGEPVVLAASTVTVSGAAASNGLGTYGPAAAFRLDDYRIYNRALTAEDVARLRNVGPPLAQPAITRQPAGGSVSAGGTFTFAVEASGEGLFYEWYRGARLLGEADGPVFTLTNVTDSQAGEYRVVISNPSGRVTSETVTLAVTPGGDAFAAWAAAAGLIGVAAQPGADFDGDGASNLAEFAFGTSPKEAGARPEFRVTTLDVGGTTYPAVSFLRRQELGGVGLEVSSAETVEFGGAQSTETVSRTAVGDGLDQVIVRTKRSVTEGPIQFFRFKVTRP